MNRRSFFGDLIKGVAAFAILPSAIASEPRRWSKFGVDNGLYVPNPAYVNAPYEMFFICSEGMFDILKAGPPPLYKNWYKLINQAGGNLKFKSTYAT